MKRLHVHLSVSDLDRSIAFYSAMFNAQPDVKKDDYAKWMLDDPRVNFAITPASKTAGLDHLGVQVESGQELSEMRTRLENAEAQITEQSNAQCCYSRGDKYWSRDPQGLAWETFHSLESIPTFGGDTLQSALDEEKAKAGNKSGCC